MAEAGSCPLSIRCPSPVDVLQDRLEEVGALDHPRLDPPPVVGFDQQRKVADRPALLVLVAVGTVGDAAVADLAVRRAEPPLHLLRAELDQPADERQPCFARPAIRVDELVRHSRQRPVARDDFIQLGKARQFRPRRLRTGHEVTRDGVCGANRASAENRGSAFRAECRRHRAYGPAPRSGRDGAPRPRRR